MKTVLLVDDSELILHFLDEQIRKMVPFEVSILKAKNYKEAVKHILQSDKIHVAILDLNLPDAPNGQIVDFTIEKGIPSIILTGTMDETLKQIILKKDILDFIDKKDINKPSQIIAKIERVLKNYNTNILVVDDSKVQLSLARDFLTKMKINVITAHNGQEALEIIDSYDLNFKLVLTDFNMPVMDGLQLTIKLREKYQKDKLGIIVLSAADQPNIASDFIKIGANDFINKPYSEIEFQTRINSNLELLDLFEKTRDLANKDFLTGSYNRRFFFESGEAIFDKNKRKNENIAVAMFDIDKFKSINDTYGHDVGDVAIKEIAKILNANLRSSDLVARFGGEEFCVLLENISLNDVEILFEKIRYAFEINVLEVETVKLKFTVSIGVCYGMEESLEKMIKVADEGLYFCKENGRNQVAINK